MTAGCGTAQAPKPAGTATTAAHPAAPAAAGQPASCQHAVSAGRAGAVVIVTLAGNSKIYCLRVGDTLRLVLPGPGAWQRPLVTGTALKLVPGTGATYAAVGPGQAELVSALPPCQIVFAPQKGGVQTRFGPAVKLSAGQSCSPGHFFSTSVEVLNL